MNTIKTQSCNFNPGQCWLCFDCSLIISDLYLSELWEEAAEICPDGSTEQFRKSPLRRAARDTRTVYNYQETTLTRDGQTEGRTKRRQIRSFKEEELQLTGLKEKLVLSGKEKSNQTSQNCSHCLRVISAGVKRVIDEKRKHIIQLQCREISGLN